MRPGILLSFTFVSHRYHKAHLTRRLILDTSADNEKEENMVEWLREVGMPADYVNKLARMFQDIKVSDDLNQNFKDAYRYSESIDLWSFCSVRGRMNKVESGHMTTFNYSSGTTTLRSRITST